MGIGVKALGTIHIRCNIAALGERNVTVSFGGTSFVPGRGFGGRPDGVIVLQPGVTEKAIELATSLAATGGGVGGAGGRAAVFGPNGDLGQR